MSIPSVVKSGREFVINGDDDRIWSVTDVASELFLAVYFVSDKLYGPKVFREKDLSQLNWTDER